MRKGNIINDEITRLLRYRNKSLRKFMSGEYTDLVKETDSGIFKRRPVTPARIISFIFRSEKMLLLAEWCKIKLHTLQKISEFLSCGCGRSLTDPQNISKFPT